MFYCELGLLDAPSGVISDFATQSVIHLTWIPPFSLKDITNYVLTITNEKSGEVTSENTSKPMFTYHWRIDHGHCMLLEFAFQVAAANLVGVGRKTTRIKARFLRCKFVNTCSNRNTVELPIMHGPSEEHTTSITLL